MGITHSLRLPHCPVAQATVTDLSPKELGAALCSSDLFGSADFLPCFPRDKMRSHHGFAITFLICCFQSIAAFIPRSTNTGMEPTTSSKNRIFPRATYPFLPSSDRHVKGYGTSTEANLFRKLLRRKKNDDDSDGDSENKDNSSETAVQEKDEAHETSRKESKVEAIPFFVAGEETNGSVAVGRDSSNNSALKQPESSTDSPDSSSSVAVTELSKPEPLATTTEAVAASELPDAPLPAPAPAPSPPLPPPVVPSPPVMPPSPVSASSEAEKLRAAAERARLEAEKMEVELTLEKLAKLEKELGSKAVEKDPDRATQIRRDIDNLKRKLNGEDVAPIAAPLPAKKSETDVEKDANMSDGTKSTQGSAEEKSSLVTATATLQPKYEPLPAEELEVRVKNFEQSPRFMKELVARAAGIDFMDISDVNVTALVIQMHEDELKYLDIEKGVIGQKPQFTQKQIDEKVQELQNVPQFVKNMYGKDKNNDTAIAILMLETEYDSDALRRKFLRRVEENAEEAREAPTKVGGSNSGKSGEQASGSKLFGNAFDQVDEKTDTEKMVEALFPSSMRSEGMEPSQAQVNILMTDVMTKIKSFSPSGKPEEVPGGFIIRGTNQFDSAQQLIDAIDDAISKSRVKEQLQVHYIADPTPVSEDQMMMGERDPVLFVTGTDLAGERNRLLLSGVSSLAIGTSWYTSLYPFLLNPALMKTSEEQLNLANAGMEYDLGFLNDMAIPLFASFMGIQIAHEAAHWAVASTKKMEITLPTLVPSLVTGLTSSITALKKPPKNKQDLFDFAISGPLAGLVVSTALLFVGCGITATLDSASFAQLPQLPLGVLRQSALAGGVIEFVLGEGMLSVPASAAGTAALADVNIPLHPFAIAGFFGLLVNAINLVPFGRTDGGRISMALFGRSGAQAAGFFTVITLLIQGLFTSDLLLFYFSFITFFQNSLDIPCRDEITDVDFSRVLLSTLTGVLVLLILIPMG